ncbi:MAG: hypothetical protein ABSD92_07415 [Candidatus Bathyarchaeia archaeon]|jgi:hypothetical protein
MASKDNKAELKKVYMAEIEKDLIANKFLPTVGPSVIILNKDKNLFELAPVTHVDAYSIKFLELLNHLASQLADAKVELATKKE